MQIYINRVGFPSALSDSGNNPWVPKGKERNFTKCESIKSFVHLKWSVDCPNENISCLYKSSCDGVFKCVVDGSNCIRKSGSHCKLCFYIGLFQYMEMWYMWLIFDINSFHHHLSPKIHLPQSWDGAPHIFMVIPVLINLSECGKVPTHCFCAYAPFVHGPLVSTSCILTSYFSTLTVKLHCHLYIHEVLFFCHILHLWWCFSSFWNLKWNTK